MLNVKVGDLQTADNDGRSRQVLLFGASNLVLGWPAVIRQLQQQTAMPLHVHTCLGMGRSYIRHSKCLVRVLPGILESKLWEHLPARPSQPALVLLTDVGNDIVYGFPPPQIQAAVREVISRIRAWDPQAEIVLTALPLKCLDDLSQLRFQIARLLLFQGRALTLADARRLAGQLQLLLTELATDMRVTLAAPERSWYGLDPIHYRRPARQTAFQSYFSHWASVAKPSTTTTVALQQPPLPVSAEVLRKGRLIFTPQPVYSTQTLQISAW